jgi:nucleoid-associated protein YgaU
VSEKKPEAKKRSRRFGILWLAALLLLTTVALVSWFIGRPVLQAYWAAGDVLEEKLSVEGAIKQLGGPSRAAARARLLLRLPDWALPEGKRGQGMRAVAVVILAACAEAGGGAEDEPGVPLTELHRVLDENRDPKLRRLCLRALAVHSRAGRSEVQKGLSDPDPGVRRAAVREADRQNMVTALLRACADGDPSVRRAAGFALAKRRDHRAVPLLIEALSCGDYWEQSKAESALENWFHGRFRGTGPTQVLIDSAVTKAWADWWKRNEPHIESYYTLTVREDDTLSGIAEMVYAGRAPGYTLEQKWKVIQAANRNVDPRRLVIGAELVIPTLPARKPGSPATTPAPRQGSDEPRG